MTDDRPTCPDEGACHHQCAPSSCFRVRCCGPLSGTYAEDRWPDRIVREHADPRAVDPCGQTDPGMRGWSCTEPAGHEPVIPRDPWRPSERYAHHDAVQKAYWDEVEPPKPAPPPSPDVVIGIRVEHLTATLDFVREDTAVVLEVTGTAVRILGTREELAGLVAELDSLLAGLYDD